MRKSETIGIAERFGRQFDNDVNVFERLKDWLIAEYFENRAELIAPWPLDPQHERTDRDGWLYRVPLKKVIELLKTRTEAEAVAKTSRNLPLPDGYLGEGIVRIGGTPFRLPTERFRRLVETIIQHQGLATTAELTNAGVSNPANAFTRLLEWENGLLSDYMERPTKRGAGYKMTLPRLDRT